jgi:hypothetical protein
MRTRRHRTGEEIDENRREETTDEQTQNTMNTYSTMLV